jgi:hypothetical protein
MFEIRVPVRKDVSKENNRDSGVHGTISIKERVKSPLQQMTLFFFSKKM